MGHPVGRVSDPDPVFCLDPDPVCPERLDPVCPERLAPDPVSLKVGSGSSQYQTGSETLVSSLTTFHFSFYYSVVF